MTNSINLRRRTTEVDRALIPEQFEEYLVYEPFLLLHGYFPLWAHKKSLECLGYLGKIAHL